MFRRSKGEIVFDVLNHIFLIGLIVATVYPLLHVIAVSLSDPSFVGAGQVGWIPRGLNLRGYEIILSDNNVLVAYRNTIAYAAVGTFLTLLLTSLLAYPLAIPGFVLKKFIVIFLTITMFFSGGLIPTYLLIRSLGLIDTFWVMVLPLAVAAYTTFVFRAFFQTIPLELRESAFMDGANDLTILFRIYLPLSKPLLATFGLFTAVGHWNRWFEALIYLRSEDRFPLQMILRRYVINDAVVQAYEDNAAALMLVSGELHPGNLRMAVIVVTMLPILLVYPFIQKYFAKGVMIGAIKG